MTAPRLLSTVWLLLFALPCRAAEPSLILERTIALHDVRGRIDHMAVDLARKRLLVAELGNGSVDVIDLAAGAYCTGSSDCASRRALAMPSVEMRF